VRVDFGAEINIDICALEPKGKEKISDSLCVRGEVTSNDGSTGHIIYVKTSIFPGLEEDIYSYRRSHPDFPDRTSSGQFFDEMQFETYRELGYQTGKKLCDSLVHIDFKDIFHET